MRCGTLAAMCCGDADIRRYPPVKLSGMESHLRIQHATLADPAQPVAIAQALEAEAGAVVRAA